MVLMGHSCTCVNRPDVACYVLTFWEQNHAAHVQEFGDVAMEQKVRVLAVRGAGGPPDSSPSVIGHVGNQGSIVGEDASAVRHHVRSADSIPVPILLKHCRCHVGGFDRDFQNWAPTCGKVDIPTAHRAFAYVVHNLSPLICFEVAVASGAK